MVNSCVVNRFENYISLSKKEKELVARLEKEEKTVSKRQILRHVGDEAKNLYVVKDGWFVTYSVLKDGKRHIDGIYTPGDIIGSLEVAMEKSISGIIAVSDGVLCPFPKKNLNYIFEESPKVTALLYSVGMLENTILLDRLRSLGRLDATAKIMLLILQLKEKLNLMQCDDEKEQSTIPFNLTQEVIADATGLTKIHVSRVIKKLKEEGYIEQSNNNIKIYKEKEMKQISGFEDRFYEIDTSWFPEKN